MRHAAGSLVRRATIALVIAAALTTTSTTSHAVQKINDAAAVQRPLSDFLNAQGSSSFFIPPLPDFIGWTNNNPQTLFASVDNLGLVSGYLASHGGPDLGTQVDGTVMERPLADGRAEVTVNLHTTNALTWVMPLPANDFANDPLVMGYRGTDLLADPSLTPALSDANMKVVFKNTAPGAALPDVVLAFIVGPPGPGQELVALSFRSTGFGPLRALFGVPEGTPGKCEVSQTGLFHTHFMGATADGFPCEHINVGVVGGGTASATPAAPAHPTALGHGSWGRLKSLYR